MKNCPVAWTKKFKIKDNPTVSFKAISDAELWIWGCSFTSPGSLNDINILDTSKFVANNVVGTMLPQFAFKVDGKTRTICYYLEDILYSKWAIFNDTITQWMTRNEQNFSKSTRGSDEVCETSVWIAAFSLEYPFFIL